MDGVWCNVWDSRECDLWKLKTAFNFRGKPISSFKCWNIFHEGLNSFTFDIENIVRACVCVKLSYFVFAYEHCIVNLNLTRFLVFSTRNLNFNVCIALNIEPKHLAASRHPVTSNIKYYRHRNSNANVTHLK